MVYPKASAKKLMKSVGTKRISDAAVTKLISGAEEWTTQTARRANEFAKHAGRQTVKAEDIELALKY
jgi:histone H3/H4